jgi:hypothetical protein
MTKEYTSVVPKYEKKKKKLRRKMGGKFCGMPYGIPTSKKTMCDKEGKQISHTDRTLL